MLSIQDLREKHNEKAKYVNKLVEENQGDQWTPELQEKYTAAMREISAIKAETARAQEVLDLIAEEAADSSVMQALERHERSGGRPSHVSAFWNLMRKGEKQVTQEEWAAIRNTMSTGTAAQGGYTVPTEVASSVADALKAYGGVRSVADVFTTASGADINYPTSDGVAETGEIIGENASASSADPSFGVVTLKTYKFSSKIIAVPFELLQDSQIDTEGFIVRRSATRVGRSQNSFFTTGTGSGQPLGVVTAAALGKVGATGQTTTVTWADLVSLKHSVDPAYRSLGNCKWMMHDSTLAALEKLVDTTGRPIIYPSYNGISGPMPDRLMGHDIVINQDMPTMAANAKSILFGDFSYYKIRDVMPLELFRFDDSAYIKLGQIGFLMWARSGGTFVDVGGAIRYYANSAT